jgi:hypothetical protein
MSHRHHDTLADLELDALPPDVQALADQLADDGAAWRDALPSTAQVEADIATVARNGAFAAAGPQGLSAVDGRAQSPARSLPGHKQRSGRLAGLASTSAVAVVVLLFISVYALHAFGPLHGHGATGRPATATLPADTTWVDQTKLDVLSSGSQDEDPVIAPSDPRVVYEAGSQLTFTTIGGSKRPTSTVILRRTDDGGTTWHTLPLPDAANLGPLQDNSSNLTFVVSPLDPHVVFLKITEGWYGATCAPIFVQKGDGWTACEPQYRSTDGGATWAPLLTPDYAIGGANDAGLHAPLSGTASMGPVIGGGVFAMLRAQGTRLYSAMRSSGYVGIRILASQDDGATWRTVDNALTARDIEIQDYAVTPTGSTIFATAATGTWAPQSPTPLTLWRSDDAGATWQRVGQLPTPYDDGLVVAPVTGQSQPLLYLDAPHITGYTTTKMGAPEPIPSFTADDLRVSGDGGRTWQSAPSAGISSTQRTYPGLLGTLADGSIVVGCLPPGNDLASLATGAPITLFTWKTGASSWQQLGPRLDNGLDTVVITTANGRQTLWVTNRTQVRLPLPTVVLDPATNRVWVPTGTQYYVFRYRLG